MLSQGNAALQVSNELPDPEFHIAREMLIIEAGQNDTRDKVMGHLGKDCGFRKVFIFLPGMASGMATTDWIAERNYDLILVTQEQRHGNADQ